MNFLETGIEGLDQILSGGIPERSGVLVEGPPGSCKTLLGMQYIYEGIKKYNQNGLYVTFEQFPQDLYRDALNFGWDLKKLEKEGKLKIIFTSPEVFEQDIKVVGSWVEKIFFDLNVQRVVIDSVTHFQNITLGKAEKRKVIFGFCNALKRQNVTTFFIKEVEQEELPFEEYLFDAVFNLSYKEAGVTKNRYIEVKKARGCNHTLGKRIFRLTNRGINVLPDKSMSSFCPMPLAQVFSTGAPVLDEALGGGLSSGDVVLLGSDGLAGTREIVGSLISEAVGRGEGLCISPCSPYCFMDLPKVLKMYGVDMFALAKKDKLIGVDFYQRAVPEELKINVINVGQLEPTEFVKVFREINKEMVDSPFAWLVAKDVDSLILKFGEEFTKDWLAKQIALLRAHGNLVLLFCNLNSVSESMIGFLNQNASTVIESWLEDNYHQLQVTKSSCNKTSNPLILKNIGEKPFFSLE
ncbi:MAG TPA: hypothetical protein ENN38_07515 [Actinobacteria bacterium]|nr:hypothetical protein [Actinomycetota bacterium]